jgi:hypothetical protein
MKKSGKLRLVSSSGPANVFDDVEALRQLAPVSTKRARSAEFFARIPHDRGYALGRQKLGGAAWALLIVLDRLIFEGRGQNPVKLIYRSREAVGLSRFKTDRALEQLEAAGVISIERRPGQAPLVRHNWFPVS